MVVYVAPIHLACSWGKKGGDGDTADTIQYMLELDPELVNAEGINGYLPIKIAPLSRSVKSIELLLHYDPDKPHQRRLIMEVDACAIAFCLVCI